MKCPNCGLENPNTAQRCGCRYDFHSKRLEWEFQDLRAGVALDEALRTVEWNCTLTEDFARLTELLSDPLTPDEVRLLHGGPGATPGSGRRMLTHQVGKSSSA